MTFELRLLMLGAEGRDVIHLEANDQDRKVGDLSDGTRCRDDDVQRTKDRSFVQLGHAFAGEEQRRLQGFRDPRILRDISHGIPLIDGVLHVPDPNQACNRIRGVLTHGRDLRWKRPPGTDFSDSLQPFDLQRVVRGGEPINLGIERITP